MSAAVTSSRAMADLAGLALSLAAAVGVAGAIALAWCGLICAFLRLSGRRRADPHRAFLDRHYAAFAGRGHRDRVRSGIDRRDIGRHATWAVPFILFAGMNLDRVLDGHAAVRHPHLLGVIATLALLYFAGYFMAMSWYGLHCMSRLGLSTFQRGSSGPGQMATKRTD